MVEVIIADDDPVILKALAGIVSSSDDMIVVGQASRGDDCLQMLNLDPDVVLLDIEMPGMSGIEVAEAILQDDNPPLVVFVTGHDEYAVRAFELAAVDYVVKGDDLSQLGTRVNAALERARSRVRGTADNREKALDSLFQLIAHVRPDGVDRLPVKDYDEQTVRLLEPAEITCAIRSNGRTVIMTESAEYPTYYTISRLATRLESSGFFQASRSAIVNLRYVEHLIPNGDGSYDVILDDGTDHKDAVITVSRGQSQKLMERLGLEDATSTH